MFTATRTGERIWSFSRRTSTRTPSPAAVRSGLCSRDALLLEHVAIGLFAGCGASEAHRGEAGALLDALNQKLPRDCSDGVHFIRKPPFYVLITYIASPCIKRVSAAR